MEPLQAIAVIGSNFGDEGKGLMTDFFASLDPSRTIVCRSNGGGQAGHTVETIDGRRHVFSQIGAGSLSGSSTYLSRYFIFNPVNFLNEHNALSRICIVPSIFIDVRGIVTTPYDIAINRALEIFRGQSRHGSVGLGINETVTRCENPEFRTTIGGMMIHSYRKIAISDIAEKYVPLRLEELGLPPDSIKVTDEEISKFEKSFDEVFSKLRCFTVSSSTEAFYGNHTVVFEGAQGLLLDENHRYFPHVTRSRTGIHNPIRICEESEITALRAVYVTRPYVTRHGAGPFPTEQMTMRFVDRTNTPNNWQKTMRFGHIDSVDWSREVLADYRSDASPKISATISVAMTWGDMERSPIQKDYLTMASPSVILDELSVSIGSSLSYIAKGRTNRDVRAKFY